MRILVIEDKVAHRRSAEETLCDHEVTIVTSFDKAMDLMKRQIDMGKVNRCLVEAGFSTAPDSEDEERRSSYWKIWEEAESESMIPLPFEVVLTDMMMPMSSRTLSEGFDPGEQVPYGFIIALKATLLGAKFVALVTDTNHHKGAMSAALDHLGSAYYREGFKPNFLINGARVMFVHAPFVEDLVFDVKCYKCDGGTVCGDCKISLVDRRCHKCERGARKFEPCHVCKGEGKHDTIVRERKDWGKVLVDLIA